LAIIAAVMGFSVKSDLGPSWR